MEEASAKEGYLYGILTTIGLLVIGYVTNSLIGHLINSRLLWPGNLYFILVIMVLGMTIGLISNGKLIKRISSVAFQVPSISVLIVFGGVLFVKPEGFDNEFLQVLFTMPVLLLSIYIYFTISLGLISKLRNLKQTWAELSVLITLLLFVFVTIVGVRDYYVLDMKVGTDRAIFEAQNKEGRYFRLPFAVKVLNSIPVNVQPDSVEQLDVRVYTTVSKFEDITLSTLKSHKLKGWKIYLNTHQKTQEISSGVVDLRLVFDRWFELKYISLILLLVSLFLKMKY